MKDCLKELLVLILALIIMFIPFLYGRYYDTDAKSVFQALFIVAVLITYHILDDWIGDK